MEGISKLVHQLPFVILGLIVVAAIASLTLPPIASSPTSGLPLPYTPHLTLPVIQSLCSHYLHGIWAFLVRTQQAYSPTTPRNLFLLINLIIFLIFTSLHLQQHAAAARKASKKEKRRRITGDIRHQRLHAPTALQPILETAAEIAMAAAVSSPQTSTDSTLFDSISVAAPSRGLQIQASSYPEENVIDLSGESNVIDLSGESNVIDLSEVSIAAAVRAGASMESLPHAELLDGSGASMKSLPAEYRPDGIVSQVITEYPPDEIVSQAITGSTRGTVVEVVDQNPLSTVDQIVLEEDGRLKLIQVADGLDSSKLEDGRPGWVDRPLPTARRKPRRKPKLRTVNHTSDSDTSKHPHELCNDYRSDTNNNNAHPTHASSCFTNALHMQISQSHVHVPKSHSLANTELPKLEAPKLSNRGSSLPRPHVKSMDATNDNIVPGKITSLSHRRKGGHVKVMRRPASKPGCEPSIFGQDELNARVENFIAKFNEQIKIQRQQSLLSYMQMVERGA